MSFREKLTEFLSKTGIISKNFQGSQMVSSSNPFAIDQPSKKLDPAKVMQEYRGWSYAAARVIAEGVASVRFRTIRIMKDQTTEEDTDNEVLDILGAMNEFMTGYEVVYITVINFVMAGNAYWLLEGVENEGDKPTGIFPIPTKDVKVIRGNFPELIKGYEVKTSATSRTFYPPEKIMHFRLPDPNDPVEGIGVVQAIAQWIDLDNLATALNRVFFKNGARIGGFLESDSAITADQLDFLQKSFEQAYSGVDQAYKVAALPKGTTFKEGQVGPKDIDYPEGSKMYRDKILAGYRVPKTILGAAESDTNRATAETADFVFANRTLKPIIELLITQLNEKFMPRYDDDLFLKADDPTPVNREQLTKEIESAMGKQSYLSYDEARERMFNANPIDNGDEVRGSIQMTPIGKVKKTKSMNRVDHKGDKIPMTRGAINAKNRKKGAEKIAEAALKTIKDFNKKVVEAQKKAKDDILTMSDEEYEVLAKAFISRVTPFEEKMIKILGKFNKEQEEEVIENVKKFLKKKGIKKSDLFDEEEWVNILIEAATPALIAAYEQEYQAATELLGFEDVTGLTPEAKRGLEKGLELMAKSYNSTTLSLLKEKLNAALAEGQGFEELKKEIQSIYEFSNEVRAAQVARSEVFRAANFATKEAWKDTGVVVTIKWYTAADERVCPWCEPLNGKTIAIEDDFFKKGDVTIGSDGRELNLDYSDIGSPPLHVSCRCYIRPEKIQVKTKKKEEKPKETPKVKKPEKKKETPKKVEKPKEKSDKEKSLEKIDQALDKIIDDK